MYPVCRKFLLLFCILVIIIYSRFVLAAAAAKHLKGNEVKAYKSPYNGTSWIKKMKELRNGVKDCAEFTKKSTWNCFKLTTLRMFDNLMTAKKIPICSGIRFVRMENVTTTSNSGQHMDYVDNNVEGKGSVHVEQQANYDLQSSQERQMDENLTWFDQLAKRLASTMSTHILEINPKQLADAYMLAGEDTAFTDLKNTDPHGTARHRRHRYNMIITMMFGVTALGAVLVPMGFQLLSVISGKALLLAKMALLLASINGLKRVANSGVHYGLYQVPGEHYGGGYYDRTDVHHPRLTMAQPIDMGI